LYFKYLPFILITSQLPKLGINWIDLDTLSLGELKQLQADVAAAIKNFETRSRAEALAELKALAASKGFSLEELTGTGKGKAKRGSAPVKFIDPAVPENTWTGRGRQPRWLVEALSSGKSLEDFAV